MNIDNINFDEIKKDLEENIKKSHFIAIDEEFSGLYTDRWRSGCSFDTVLYKKINRWKVEYIMKFIAHQN